MSSISAVTRAKSAIQSNPGVAGSRSGTIRALLTTSEIRAALNRLDARLSGAITAFDAIHGGPVVDRFRGLVISHEQCDALLEQEPMASPFLDMVDDLTKLWPIIDGSTAQWLAGTFKLQPFDMDVMILSLAVEFDLKYERLFGYLQDDVTRKRPTVALALDLFCKDEEERLFARAHFAADSPLVYSGLIHLAGDPNSLDPPLLAQFIRPDEQMVRWLLGAGGLHPELAACATRDKHLFEKQVTLVLDADARLQLEQAGSGFAAKSNLTPIWLQSPAGSDSVDMARLLAQAAESTLLRLDATRVVPKEAERTLRLAIREAWIGSDVLCVEHVDVWLGEPHTCARIAEILREPLCPVVLGSAHSIPTELLGVALPWVRCMSDASQRQSYWLAALAMHGVVLKATEHHALSARFRLTREQISAAVADAALRSSGKPSYAALGAAARAQSGDALATVADKVDARATWDDIVLSPDAVAQLRELCQRVEQHERVFNDWGFGAKLSRGRGTTALFSGGSGTGKTMAAEVIANALGLDLYRIDLARVVNKYIGETEKNLDRVFAAAESANAILFFDEADALFGKRSEVKDAHDRYANIEVSYLLQKMEEYDGVAILASNLADNLDEAFTRRLALAIHFPFPDEAARLDIWRRAWPEGAPMANTVDLTALARSLKLSGGSIKNIALGAAFFAATDQAAIDEHHLLLAVRREQQKTGRSDWLPTMLAGGMVKLDATPIDPAAHTLPRRGP